MGSASQRSVQDLYEDVGDHYRIFIRAPFFQLLKHRDYWVPLLYFFFVLITMFWDLYCHSGQYLYEARSLLPFYLFPFLIAALRIGDIVVDTRCRNVENLGASSAPPRAVATSSFPSTNGNGSGCGTGPMAVTSAAWRAIWWRTGASGRR